MSTDCIEERRIRSTIGKVTTAWQNPIQTTFPTSPKRAVRKYIAIAVITCGTISGISMKERRTFFARNSPRTSA